VLDIPVIVAVKKVAPPTVLEDIEPTVPDAEIVTRDPVDIEDVVLALLISIFAIGYVLAASFDFAAFPSANHVPLSAFHKPPELEVPSDPVVVLLKLSEKDVNAPETAL
jgi:hypothetical protein